MILIPLITFCLVGLAGIAFVACWQSRGPKVAGIAAGITVVAAISGGAVFWAIT